MTNWEEVKLRIFEFFKSRRVNFLAFQTLRGTDTESPYVSLPR